MKKSGSLPLVIVWMVSCVCMVNADVAERETFGKWHIGVGAAFNVGATANLRSRNLPTPRMYAVPFASTRQNALDRANNHIYDGNGIIRPDSSNVEPDPHDWFDTENWQLPKSSYQGSGRFLLDNAYEEVLGSSFASSSGETSDSEMQYGISVEVSRELWVHDENDEHRWGLDFAAGFSYFFRRDIYSAHGSVQRTDTILEGAIRTVVDDPAATYDYDPASLPAMLGDLNFDRTLGLHPRLGWDAIGDPAPLDGRPTHSTVASCGYHASGDYRELEMLFMLRPWYEIRDWWRIYAEVGMGVSWGRFESSFSSSGFCAEEDFSQWDAYGVAGLGTAFRYDEWTLGIDFLGRFWRDDLDVDGRYVSGSIERSDWGFRVMLGYEF